MYEILLLILQIIIEALPISSSTHVALAIYMLQRNEIYFDGWVFEKATEFTTHLPTAFLLLIYCMRMSGFQFNEVPKRGLVRLGCFVIVSTLVTCCLYPFFKNNFFMQFPSWLGLVITSCSLFSLRYTYNQADRDMTLKDALIMGGGQACALLPGISRLAFTLALLQWLGYSARFSFYYTSALQIVLFGVAGSVGLLLAVLVNSAFITPLFVVGVVLASCIAYLLVDVVARMILTNRLWYFAFYTIILAYYLYHIS